MDRVLLLNYDNVPIHVTTWKKAVLLLIKGKAECVDTMEKIEDFLKDNRVPNTIKLVEQKAIPEMELPFSRHNIFIRDEYTCQYCGKKFPASELTIDHVFPKSRLGPDIWENIVTCCKHCNQYKADRTPKEAGMKLLRRPDRPRDKNDFEMLKGNPTQRKDWAKYYKKAG